MSEVKRYAIRGAGKWEAYEVKAGAWVRWHDFDAQRLRADTAEAKAADYLLAWGKCAELRDAAEQRIAELTALLQRVVDSSVMSFEADAPEDLESLEVDICAALNPNPEAESHE